ncbi:MAG: NADH-quinone oxidoreductase subunit A [Planctomycetes bacterium]|nr:NADH-quinone oxidoreductase subunit A [Planctomycetota bacterium]
MLHNYGPLAFYAFLAVSVGAGALVLSALLGPRRKRKGKMDPYECGVPLVDSAHGRFNVRFYLVALFFILFDIETVFLIPWALIHRSLGVAGLVEMGIFVGVLAAGLAYVWKRGALEWE